MQNKDKGSGIVGELGVGEPEGTPRALPVSQHKRALNIQGHTSAKP